MNRTLGIVLCSSVVSIPLFSADVPSSSVTSSSTALPSDPLVVPQVRSWLKHVHEAKEPEVITLIKNHTGQEPFHEVPAHQRMLSEHLEQLMRTLNDDTVHETAKFLTLCQQKGIQIEYMASDDLFRLAYHKRTVCETQYKTYTEAQIQGWQSWPARHIAQMKTDLESNRKQAEQQVVSLGSSCASAKARHEPTITAYTTIMQLTQKLNPQYAPAYATDPAKYYGDIEQQFTLAAKMQVQAALAARVQEIKKLLAEVALMGKAPAPVQSDTQKQIELVGTQLQKLTEHLDSASKHLSSGLATVQPSSSSASSTTSTSDTATPSKQ